MSHYHAVQMFVPMMKALCAILLTVVLLAGTALAQSRTPTDGYTPTGLASGAPAGSYPLSGFDNINLFNGHLSLDLPLLQVGARGAAGLRLKLPVDWAGRGWEIRSDIINISGSDYEVKSAIMRDIQTPLYRPIRLIGIRTADRSEGSINHAAKAKP